MSSNIGPFGRRRWELSVLESEKKISGHALYSQIKYNPISTRPGQNVYDHFVLR